MALISALELRDKLIIRGQNDIQKMHCLEHYARFNKPLNDRNRNSQTCTTGFHSLPSEQPAVGKDNLIYLSARNAQLLCFCQNNQSY